MVWVLSPLVPPTQQASAPQRQSLWWLIGPEVTVGRPLKGSAKGSTDVVISNDSSVSKLHATLQLAPPSAPGEAGAVTVTDLSKFGTTISQGTLHNVKLQAQVPTALSVGAHISFGVKGRFQLSEVAIHIHVPETQLPAVTAAAARIGAGTTSQWSNTITQCLVADGAAAGPAVAAALLCKVPLVQQSWLEAVAQQRAWQTHLPLVEQHAPRQVLLPGGGQLVLAGWQAPPGDLLSSYHFVVEASHSDPALEAAAEALGGLVTNWRQPDALPTPSSRTLVAVLPDGLSTSGAGPADSALAQLQQSMPAVGIDELLQCMLTGDVDGIQAAVMSWQTQQQQQQGQGQQQGQEQQHEEEGEEDVTEEGEHEEGDAHYVDHTSGLQPQQGLDQQQVAVPGVRQQLRTLHMSAATATDAPGTDSVAAAAAPVGRGTSKRCAEEAHMEDPGQGWHSSTQKRRRSNVPTTASTPSAAHVPSSGRGKRAGQHAAAPAVAAAIAAAAAAATAPPPEVADDSSVPANEVVLQPLVVSGASHKQAAAAAAAPSSNGHTADAPVASPGEAPNFKAFRRKGAAAGAVAAVMRPLVPLMVYAEGPQGTDADTFLLEEEQRKKRQQKADELFSTAAPKPKTSRKK